MTLRTTILSSTFVAAIAVVSCGGSSSKKTQEPPDDAGAAGEAQQDNGGAGGAEAPDGVGGEGGTIGSGGESGAVEQGGEGGEGPPPVHVLFTVGSGAKGLSGSGVASSQSNTANVIYGSNTESPDDVTGTNRIVITAEQLGLAANDTISAFTAARPEPEDTLYLFSIAGDGPRSISPTRLHRSSIEDGANGDVYSSDARISYFYGNGEGPNATGYNALVADERSLGLMEGNQAASEPDGDDLTGVLPLPEGVLPNEIYFAVGRQSTGLPGTAVADTAAAERGCTVFKSALDGKNEAAYSCDDLGIAADGQLRGLALIGTGATSSVLFTVDSTTAGAADTELASPNNFSKSNYIWASPGDGSNTVHRSGYELGLDAYDEIDALALLDRAAANYGVSDSCAPTPGFFDPEGANLGYFYGAHGLNNELIMIYGSGPFGGNQAPPDVIAVYNVRTCAFVSRTTLPPNTLESPRWAAVRLAGWVATDPLEKVEYWQLHNDSETGIAVQRLDADGVPIHTYSLAGLGGEWQGQSLEYDPVNDRLIGVIHQIQSSPAESHRVVFKRPTANMPNGPITPLLRTPIPHPCANAPALSGVDAAGNSYFGQSSGTSEFRICPLSPTGEFADIPWTVSVGTYVSYGMIVPGVAVYGVETYPSYQFRARKLARP